AALRVWTEAARGKPASGTRVTGIAAASASVFSEVRIAQPTGTSQASASAARITKARMRNGSGLLRRRRPGRTGDGDNAATARAGKVVFAAADIPSHTGGTRSPCRRWTR